MKRPPMDPEGPRTLNECRQIVAYHQHVITQLERRIQRLEARWEKRWSRRNRSLMG